MNCPIIQGNYRSQVEKKHWLAPLSPNLAFYLPMMKTVFLSSRAAKRGHYGDNQWAESSYEIFHHLERAGVQFEIENMNVVDRLNSPCVVIGNHMSTLETFVLPFMLQPHLPIVFVVKKELTQYPVFRYVMNSRNPIVVGRTNPKEDLQHMMQGAEERLKKNISILIFPQTTRTHQFDPSQFNTIGVKIAKRNNVPVVPLALKTNAWGNGTLIKDFGKINPNSTVHFAFGEPMEVEGNGKATHEKIVQFIQAKLKSWKEN